MPKFRITGPDGKVYEVTGPEGSTAEQALAWVRGGATQVEPAPNGLGTDGENFAAGIGKGLTDVARGAGQIARKMNPAWAYSLDALGLPGDQATIDEAKRLDKPLMDTKAGMWGNVVGQAVPAVLAAPVAGSGYLAGAGTGAAMGAMQPVASDESRLNNTLLGGVGGAGGVLAGRLLGAGYQGGKALLEPLTESGRNKIAGRVLNEFGVGAKDVAGLSGAPSITGARPNLAELIRDPQAATGAAKLQDTLRTLDPKIAGQFTAREAENNAARVGLLQDLAGAGGGREAALGARELASKPRYEAAFANTSALTPSQLKAQESLIRNGTMEKLMESPAIRAAQTRARENALNRGQVLEPEGSIRGMHSMKLALDDMIGEAKTAAQREAAGALKSAQQRLIGVIETLSPEYSGARQGYAALSKPINEMDTVQGLLRAGTNGGEDIAGNQLLSGPGLLKAIRDPKAEAALVKSATGRPLGLLSDVLQPDSLTKVNAVRDELARASAVGKAANGPNSATAGRFASNNLMRQVLGPLGLPQSWSESTLLQTAMRPVQFAANAAEPKIQQQLAELVMNPQKAEAALKAAGVAPAQIPAAMQDLMKYVEQAGRASVPAGLLAQ